MAGEAVVYPRRVVGSAPQGSVPRSLLALPHMLPLVPTWSGAVIGEDTMPTRRKFIGALIGTGAALVPGVEPALGQSGRKRLIVDAQIQIRRHFLQ